MNDLTNAAEISVARGEIVRLNDAAGSVIRVREGLLWITQDGESADHLLPAGTSFRIERRGLTLVSALRCTRLQVCSAQPAAADPRLSLAA